MRPLALIGVVWLLVGCRAQERRVEPAVHAGSRYTLATHEGTPWGTRTTRETWDVREVQGERMLVARQVEGRDPVESWVSVRPRVTRMGPYSGSPRGRRVATDAAPRPVVVPAGRFRCARTTRTHTLGNGMVMHTEEWWAPGVPVPVQRWTIWSGNREELRDPPRAPERVPIGTTWAVLESAPRR